MLFFLNILKVPIIIMYIRVKKFGKDKNRRYYYIVRVEKSNKGASQKVVKYLGTIESILAKFQKT